jgi:hypothetical protein
MKVMNLHYLLAKLMRHAGAKKDPQAHCGACGSWNASLLRPAFTLEESV